MFAIVKHQMPDRSLCIPGRWDVPLNARQSSEAYQNEEPVGKLEVPGPILADILIHAEERLLSEGLPVSALVSGGLACHSSALWDWCLPMSLLEYTF